MIDSKVLVQDTVPQKINAKVIEPTTGGGGGTSNYEELSNKPYLNNKLLIGEIIISGDNLPLSSSDLDGNTITEVLDEKQPKLVSGTNIKTINNQSLLGSGNINVSGGGGTSDYNDLENKPSINNVLLKENVTLDDLNLYDKSTVDTKVGNVNKDLTTEINRATTEEQRLDNLISTKVDKEVGKGLSTNDYTTIDKNRVLQAVGLPTYNPDNYTITFKDNNGNSQTIDLPIEQIGVDYDPVTKSLIFINSFGVTVKIPISDLVDIYVGSTTENVIVSVEGGNVISAKLTNQFIEGLFSGNYNDLSNKPIIPTITEFGVNKQTYEAALTTQTSSDTIVTLYPNKLYNLGERETLEILLIPEVSGFAGIYSFVFSCGSNPTQLTVPSTIKWLSAVGVEEKIPTLAANKTYEVNIMQNRATIGECEV